MTWRNRVVADSANREAWLSARGTRIGASDAAKFTRPESVPRYIAAKLRPSTFHGNTVTERGNRWETLTLDYFGMPHNTLLVHAEGEPGFAATPDGILEADGVRALGEVKTFTGKVIDGIPPAYYRQMQWQMFVMGFDDDWFMWRELTPAGAPRRGRPLPQRIIVHRDEDAINKLVAIARPVLEGVRAAQQAERQFHEQRARTSGE